MMATQGLDMRTVVRWIAVAASTAWITLTIYQEFIDVDPTQYGFKSAEVDTRLKSCSGTFQQRYDCKEAVIIAKGHRSFAIWAEKVALILGPPLIVGMLLNRLGQERSSKDADYYTKPPPPVTKRRVR